MSADREDLYDADSVERQTYVVLAPMVVNDLCGPDLSRYMCIILKTSKRTLTSTA